MERPSKMKNLGVLLVEQIGKPRLVGVLISGIKLYDVGEYIDE